MTNDAVTLPLSGDADRLQQVIRNLLTNAIKFTPAGGRVELRVCRGEGVARVEVRDTGRGMSSTFLPFAFDRFRQNANADGHTGGGLGLGLAIVKDIVELHGGSVAAASAGEGRGATIHFTLPIRPPPAAS